MDGKMIIQTKKLTQTLERVQEFSVSNEKLFETIKDNIQAVYYNKVVKAKDDIYLWRFNSGEDGNKKPLLILDYDNNKTSIENFVKRFSKYEFYLHTTSSHTPENHCFRVYMPISTPWKQNYILQTLKPFQEAVKPFLNVDLSTFDNRFFYIPSWNVNYKYIINSGIIFDTSKESKFFKNISKFQKDLKNTLKKTSIKNLNKDFLNNPTNLNNNNSAAYNQTILSNLSREILNYDINNRGSGRGTYSKLFYFIKKAQRALNNFEEAREWVKQFADDNLTIDQINLHQDK